MNALDIILIVLAAVLILIGFLKGIVRILITAAAVVVAFIVASRFHAALAEGLAFTGFSAEALGIAAYLILFFSIMIAGGIAAWLARKLVKAALLGCADRLAGGALGFAVAVVVAGLIVLPLVAYVPSGATLLSGSTLAPYVSVLADLAKTASPKDLADRYAGKIDGWRRIWRGERELLPKGQEPPSSPAPDRKR